MLIKVKRGTIKSGGALYGAGEALTLDEKTAKSLIAGGFADAVDADFDANSTPHEPDDVDVFAQIDKMTEKELKEFAAENEIDITGLRGKADIKARVLEDVSTWDNDGHSPDEEDGGGA